MARYVSGKMKRKEGYSDFSDLLLSEPATKIRRLDAELPLITDNEGTFDTSVLAKALTDEKMSSAVLDGMSGFTEDVLPSTLNEERALVMYKPSDAPLASSLKINPKLITCLKNYTFWPRNPNMQVGEESREEIQSSAASKCLALVPWVPSHASVTRQVMEVLASGNEQNEVPMEVEEGAVHTFMEIEEDMEDSNSTGVGVEGSQQWQHHCMTPQLLQSNSTMMWS